MAKIIYDPLPPQELFHTSDAESVILSGGYGSGKTFSLCQKIFQLCNYNKSVPGGILCPDLKMFKRDVMPTVRNILRFHGLYEGRHYKFNKVDMCYYFPQTNSEVYIFHSQDDGESIRGPNLGWGVINEVTLCTKDAYLAFIARIRDKNARFPQKAMSGTPEGFNWFHDHFMENPKSNTEIFYCNTRQNKHLHDSYIKTLEDQYDPLMQKQYIDGQAVNLTGNQAAWAFNREKHVKEASYDINAKVWVSIDFNVNPMSAIFWNYYPPTGTSTHVLKAFDEICFRDSNTFMVAKYLKEYFREKPITIYPDPAGNQRRTSSLMSDIQILENHGFKDIRYKKVIVSVKDCLNALNAFLHKHIVEIDPRCKNTIKDFERCILGDDLTIEKKDPMRTHWIDGAKNMIDYEFPIIRPDSKIHVRSI